MWNFHFFYISGRRNVTPSNTAIGPLQTRRTIAKICDDALIEIFQLLRPRIIVAIGNEAEGR